MTRKQTTREQRASEQLRKASGHLRYEFDMFTTLVPAMISGVFGEGPLHDAVLESLIMHARNLLDFLYKDMPWESDVIAEDYFDKPSQWREIRPPMTEVLTMARSRADKQVAHLTYDRIEVAPEDRQWPVAQIAEDISTAFAVFLEHVSKDRLSLEWRSVKLVRWHLLSRKLDSTIH